MDWLIHNPIADIHGPAFLLAYSLIAVVIIAVAYGNVRGRDKSGLRALPPVPGTVDPYEIAYLRGGKNAVIRTVLYALRRRGLVTVIPKERFKPIRLVATGDVHDGALTELEQQVLRWISRPTDPSSLFGTNALGSAVERLCEPLRRRLESDELLRTGAMKGAAVTIPLAATAVLVALTVYKVVIATAERRPFGFLLMLTMVALVVLWIIVGRGAFARVSDRGKAFLERLRVTYGNELRPATRRAGQAGPSDLPSVAMVGLFGLGILSATPDAAFAALFARSAAAGGSCGSGCGGGGCGGGGCGGGCGG